jgi:hypothetical protein
LARAIPAACVTEDFGVRQIGDVRCDESQQLGVACPQRFFGGFRKKLHLLLHAAAICASANIDCFTESSTCQL